jgi:hypothetical protein
MKNDSNLKAGDSYEIKTSNFPLGCEQRMSVVISVITYEIASFERRHHTPPPVFSLGIRLIYSWEERRSDGDLLERREHLYDAGSCELARY